MSRWGMVINNVEVPHATLTRQWCCGTCAEQGEDGKLTTNYIGGEWVTFCRAHPEHPVEKFITLSKAFYQWQKAELDKIKAREVLEHLPPEVQAIIHG